MYLIVILVQFIYSNFICLGFGKNLGFRYIYIEICVDNFGSCIFPNL